MQAGKANLPTWAAALLLLPCTGICRCGLTSSALTGEAKADSPRACVLRLLVMHWLAGLVMPLALNSLISIRLFVGQWLALTFHCVVQIFLSLAHEKSNYGNCSPGPGTAVHESGLGHSTLSRYR